MLLHQPLPRGDRALALSIAALISILLSTQFLLARLTPAAAAPAAPAVIATPLPHFRATKGRMIDTVVVHYISGINVDRDRWDDPALARAILRNNRVSAHYLLDRAGKIYRLVDERNIAWHAGGSIMPAPDNRRNVNHFSIGIEVIATHGSGFTGAQYTSLSRLIDGIKSRYTIRHIVGHDQISGVRAVQLGLRKDVKPDPGPRFDWPRLRALLADL